MSKSSQDQYRKETTTNNSVSVQQENSDQQHSSSIQMATPTPEKTKYGIIPAIVLPIVEGRSIDITEL
ncbi:unnamed protein product [Rotaria socialis]